MILTGEQLAAVVKIGIAMASADGVVTDAEMNFIAYELSRFGVKPAEVNALIDSTIDLPFDQAVSTISHLDDDCKHYVSAFLGAVMAADREVDTTELRLWQYTCSLCSLPTLTLSEAISYMRNLD